MTMDSHITSATINGDRKLVYDAAESSAGVTAPSENTSGAGMAASTSGSHPSLNGVWKLNAAKSDFGQGQAPASQIDTIEDNEPSVKIVEDQKGGFMGDMNITSTLSSDGKPTTSTGMGGAQVTSTAHWEGGSLVVNSKTSFQGSDVTIKDTFTPSADGKTLKEVAHIETSMGNFDTTSVFDKQ
jgi:hypothetical protein